MILLDDFYKILEKEDSPGVFKAKISINKDHKIFEGHFPGLPVVPGVCMMQMIRELLEVCTDRELKIVGADNMKFLSVINPDNHLEIDGVINYQETAGSFSINATLFAGTTTFFKLKATLQTI